MTTPHGSKAPDPVTGLPSEAELKELTLRELGRPLAVLLRLRWLILIAELVLVAVFVASGAAAWRTWLLGLTGTALALLATWDHRRGGQRDVTPGRILALISSVWTIHTAIIVSTGGIESPFLMLYLPVAVVAGAAIGELRLLAVLLGAQVAAVWLFAAAAALGASQVLLPEALTGGLTALPLWRWTAAATLTAVLPVAALFGLRIRAALDRAVVAAAFARHEALLSMRERNRALLDLSGALAHELKNPLASIAGLATLLARKQPEGGREAEQMAVLQGEVRRMALIVEEFLNFSRPVQALAVREVPLAPLLAEVVVLHEGLALARGVALQTECEPELQCACDSRKIRQILGNLVGNAIEASATGQVVRLRAVAQGETHVALTVEDDGAGLSDPVRSRLFTPGATSKALGSGLGLVIAKAIAEQHGGTLGLHNRSAGGCTATVVLPRKLPVAAEA